ncbi:MAG: hypothetical protein M3440_08430 [Chloroflexota bacterium]|nr:hypothetical protein [Chloroflexota bacterium]
MTDTITLTLTLEEAETLHVMCYRDVRFGDAAENGVVDEVHAIMAKIDVALNDAWGIVDDEDGDE